MRIVKIQRQEEGLKEAAKRFLLVKEAQHCSENTLRDYKVQIGKFVAASSDSLVYENLEKDVLKYFAEIPDTSPARYNKPFQNVNAFFNWLVEQGELDKNPIKANKLRKRRDDGNIKPASIDQLRAFLAGIEKNTYCGLRDYTIIMVMLDTGIRTSELLSLQEGHYCREESSILIEKNTAKTRRQRVVYLSRSTASALNSFLKIKPREWEPWLFPNYEGMQLTVTHLDKAFAKYSEKSGVKITPYQLRHSFATLFLTEGGDLFSLQRLMGHSDLRMTKRYTELDEDFIRKQHRECSPANLLAEAKTKRMTRI